ncbi:MAG: NifU family protein [Acidimicrobiales bacterium]
MAPNDLRATGDRIEEVLESLSTSLDRPMWEQVQDVVALVTDLYGGGLARILEVIDESDGQLWEGQPGDGRPGIDRDDLVARLVDDDLVASLLVVHDQHPVRLEERVRAAIDTVRPYLGSHGGDVEVLDVDGDAGVVTVRMLGSCDGCASSSVTLELAVRRAIIDAAPEIDRIEVEGADPEVGGAGSDDAAGPVPVVLGRRPEPVHAPTMAPIYGLRALAPGRVGALEIDGTKLIVCRVGAQLYAYVSHCPECDSALDGASVEGPVLRCAVCASAYDLPRAGRSLDGRASHLDPLPLLEEGGEVRIAVAATR